MTDKSLPAYLHIVPRTTAKACGISSYLTASTCRRGHASERSTATGHCLACERERAAKRAQSAEYREKRSASARARNAEPEAKEKLRQKYYSADWQKVIQAKRLTKEHRQRKAGYAKSSKGRAAIAARDKRRRSTPHGVAAEASRYMIRRCLELIGSPKKNATNEYLGYSASELASHLEVLFQHGMGWHNRGKWHIDHIRPLSSFDLADPEQLKAANSLTNLRPMWAKLNLRKSDSWDGQFTLLM